jgi:hypothetical protein
MQLKFQVSRMLESGQSERLKKTIEIFGEIVGKKSEKIYSAEITCFYPKEFEDIRKRMGIIPDLYMKGLNSCVGWDCSGGKSNSIFAKAKNDLIVFKIVKEK